MNQPLFVTTDDVTSLSNLHGEVAAAVSDLAGLAPETDSAEVSYGTIASGFTSALRQALPSRDGALRATSTAGRTIEELLRTAARLYEEGDQQNAEKLRAAADALASSGASERGGPVAGGAAAGPGAAAGGGAETPAQMAGQVGQQVGQLAQGIAQSVQGLAQGLTQLPQQIMQGVQGLTQSAEAAKSARLEADEKKDGDDEKEDAASERSEELRDRREAPAAKADGAQPGHVAARPPEPPPAVKPAPPAQTRPQ